MMGWQDVLPVEIVWFFAVLVVLAAIITLVYGLRRFKWPARSEAVARVDAALPGRPIAAIADEQAIGASDPASQAVWNAHLARMARRTEGAKPVEPDLRVASRDPYGLRYLALLCFVAATLFGSLWRVSTLTDTITNDTDIAVLSGPTWEGWVQPPAYTGKPTLYLADITPGTLRIPVGSRIILRLYGEVGALTISETVSGRVDDIPPASAEEQSFEVVQAGTLSIDGENGAAWDVVLIADAPPTVSLSGPMEIEALGEMAQPFAAQDDYAIIGGTATIALNLPAVDRRFGLLVDPDPIDPLVLDLPLPISGDRDDFQEQLIDDFSQHPWANLPVTMTLQVTDAPGQVGQSEVAELILPGRRFFQPVAKAVIEQRRDLLWSKSNAPRVVDVLRAVSHRPDDIFRRETTYLRLRFTLRRLSNMADLGLTNENQAEIAQALWDLAIQLEEGTLADARERLERAQERLAEAMRNGASDEEIAELMQELREATDDYMNMLAQNAQPRDDGTDQPDQAESDRMEFTMDELQALMDRIEELMQEGRMAEAQELMEQLNELMQNMEVVQDPNAQGGPGQQSMQDLAETLRDQQGLSDDAFRELQEQFNPGNPQSQPQQGGDGEGEQGEQEGQGLGQGDNPEGGQQNDQGAGGEGDPQQSLADRQRALRGELDRQRDALPNLGGEAADEARDALDRADGAMDRAEEALRQGDLAEAIDRQAEALNALRDGMRSLGDAIAENSEDQPGQGGEDGERTTRAPGQRDPLGRELGENGQLGSEDNMLQQDVQRRAEELLDEIRRRSSEQDRPEGERNYLKRLLDRF